jgi:hypothetical protein
MWRTIPYFHYTHNEHPIIISNVRLPGYARLALTYSKSVRTLRN